MREFALLICICFYCKSSAQNIDVAPFLSQCKNESTLQESIDSSEKIIYDYFLLNVDEQLCPTNDSTARYWITIDINKKGKASFQGIYNYEDNVECNSYFENRSKEFCKRISFEPALFKRKKQSYAKKNSVQLS